MRKSFTLTVLLILTLFACKEDFDVFIPDDTPLPDPQPLSGDITRFFESVSPEVHSYVIDADQGALFRTPRNTWFTVPQRAFLDEFNSEVAGEVKVEIIEILNKAEMILHNVPTESDGKLIRSSGAYHIRVTRNDQTLGLKEGVEIEIQIPIEGQWSEKMELFYGERHPDGQFNWVEADNDPNSQNNVWLGEMYDSLTQEWGLSYQLYSSQLNWINCDEFMEAGELVKLDVALPETYSDTNTVAFIVFDQLNAVMAMQWNANEKVFTENYVPINETVTLLIIAERGDNDFYFSSLNTTVTADKVIEMSPEEIPLGDIVEFISGL